MDDNFQEEDQDQDQPQQPPSSSGARKSMQMARRAQQVKKATQAAKMAVSVATSETVIIPLLIKFANKKNAKRLLYVTLGILLLFIILFGSTDLGEDANISVTLKKTAPAQVGNDENITYGLNVSYTGNPISITVTDKIPDNADYVSSGGPGNPTYNETTRTVTWTIPISGGGNNNGSTIGNGATSLIGLFQEAGQKYSVPPALLMATNKLESGVIDTWTDEDVKKFSVVDWWKSASDEDLQRGWAFNQCDTMQCGAGSDVQGIMQFEIGTWDWVGTDLKFDDGHTPNRLYPRDAIYGAGNLTRIHADEYDAAFGTSANDWPEDKVRKVATAYCTGNINGDPSDGACTGGGAPYDDVVWGYYQEYKSKYP